MIRFYAPVVGLLMLAGLAGCQSKSDKMEGTMTPAAVDVCPTCRGAQRATVDGKCESCGAVVAAADACPHCAGTQVATAEGKCPSCGARMGR